MQPGDRKAAKAAAAAALKRADFAASKAVAKAGYRCTQGDKEKIRMGGESFNQLSVGDRQRSSLPLDSQSQRGRIAQFLRASSELSVVSGELGKLHGHEDHFDRLDRRLVEVEKTRSLIASVCGDFTRERDPQHSVKELPNFACADASRKNPSFQLAMQDHGTAGSSTTSTHSSARTKALAHLSDLPRPPSNSSSNATSAAKRVSKSVPSAARVVELRPHSCPAQFVNEDCACCLCPLGQGSMVLAFPCAANHLFHAGCLQRWLKTAGSHTTCPMCRAWPRADVKRPMNCKALLR